MVQKAVRSEASSPNSLSPERDWPEVRGEECGPWTSSGTETKRNRKILLPALHRGKELRRLPGRLGAWLGRGGCRSPARGSTHRLMCRFGLGRSSSGGRRRAPTAIGRLRPGPGGSGGWCIMPGQDVLDRLGLLLYRRELLGEALDGVAEQPCLGDGGIEKACLVDVLHLSQVEPEMALLDHHGGHRLPEGPRRDFRRS